MKELKRIFGNRRLTLCLLLVFLINGILFAGAQRSQDFGLDLSGPSTGTISVGYGGSFESGQEKMDGAESYQTYQKWLGKYKDMPLSEAAEKLEQEKLRLDTIFEASELIKNDGGMFGQEALKKYREEEPELIRQLENDEIDLEQARLDYVAADNLLQQISYLSGYGDYLASIQANKESMLSFSIFNDPNSFASRNIIKTAEEFGKLKGVSLELGADGAVDSFLGFAMTDYLLLAVLALICISFLEERKKGLWSVVHASPRGRLLLAFRRLGILFGVSAASVLLLYGTNLALGFSLYGGLDDLGRAAQSVEVLGKLPLPCTVGQFLTQYMLLRIAAACFVALLLWLLLTAINNVKYTIIVAAGVLVAEYSLYTFLPVQSFLNAFKYFNIFTYISLSDFYTNYLNIDLFGFPLGIRSISQLAMLPLGILLTTVCIAIHCHKKPAAGKDLLGRIAYRLNSITDKGLRHLRLLGMELHKTLLIQKGFVVVLLFAYLAAGLSFTATVPVNSAAEAAARQYTAELEGIITDSTFQRLDEIQAGLDEAIAAFQTAKEQYERGEMEYPQFDIYAREGEAAKIKLDGLRTVRERAEALREQGAQKGFTPWLVEDTPYQSVYGEPAQENQQKAAMVALLTLALLLAGCMAYEEQSGMANLLASTGRGRGILLRGKIALAAILTTGIWATLCGLELHAFFGGYSTATLSAPIQNLAMLENFPFPCGIGGFLILLYLARWAALFGCAMLALLVSAHAKRMEVAYIAASGILLLPSLLFLYMGLEPFRYLSLALPVGGMSLLLPARGGIGSEVIALSLTIALSTFAYFNLRKKMKCK